MLIKVNGLFLDFNDVIDMEQQARLFQDVSGVFGDYSYSFSIPITDRNLAILDLKSINQRLTFGQKKDCLLFSDAGEELFGGYLRIESIGEAIECSFYSGNNSWFEATRRKLREYNFKRLEKDFNYTNVSASWSLTNGIVWPLVDKGTLYKRDTPTMVDNDWQPFVYVKDVISTILAESGGIKIAGDVLRDPLYTSMITTNGGVSSIESKINEQSAYIGKNSSQSVSSDTYATLTFTDTNDPYSESDHWNVSTSTFTVPSDWIVGSVEFNLKVSGSFPLVAIKILLNGVDVYEEIFGGNNSINEVVTINNASEGDTILIQTKRGFPITAVNFTVLTGSFIKIRPVKLRRVYPQQLLPDIDANEFISNVFTQLNVFSSYDYKTNTINTRMLENIKKADEIDLSQYVVKIKNHDFTELIGDYSKSSRFLYGEASDDFTEQYNAQNPDLFYGGGFIVIENDFLEDKSDFVELDFFAPWQVPVSWLGFRLPLLEMSELATGSSVEYSRVTNSSNYARFSWFAPLSVNIFDAHVGNLVKITDKGGVDYNGIFRVTAKGFQGNRAYIETDGAVFLSDSSGTLEVITVVDIVNEDQITICNVPSTPITNFSNITSIKWGSNDPATFSLGYFWLPQVKKPINRIKQSLTFGRIADPEYYQKSLLETYYPVTNQVLNDPVMITAEMYLPENVFLSLDFLRPVRIKTEKVNGLFLINRKFGYNGSHLPCELELVKISNSELTGETTGVIVEDAPEEDPITYRVRLQEEGTCTTISFAFATSTKPLTIGYYYPANLIGDVGTTALARIIAVSSSTPTWEIYDFVGEPICT